jgi:hypothetical protein
MHLTDESLPENLRLPHRRIPFPAHPPHAVFCTPSLILWVRLAKYPYPPSQFLLFGLFFDLRIGFAAISLFHAGSRPKGLKRTNLHALQR